MYELRLRTFRKGRSFAHSMSVAAVIGWALVSILVERAEAQSFFATIIVDPVAGVDRGSASQIQKVDEQTLFLTFDNFGSEDVGRDIAGLGYSLPGAVAAGDQLDMTGVVAGPSDDGGQELLAGGLAYRFPLDDGRTYLFARADHGEITLGTPANLALAAQGSRTNVAVGLQRTTELEKMAKLVTAFEFAGRHGTGEVLGVTVLDEDLRLMRASLLYQQGIPLLFQRRFAVAVTKGFDSFGASPVVNPQSTNPGASSDFLRVSFSAEASVPLSQSFVTNIGVIGQWSEDRLPTSQRCGYGTNAYSRGFDLSYVNGDQCLGSRVELAYNVEIPDRNAKDVLFTQAFAGVDFGKLWENPAPSIAQRRDTWSSGSVGIRTLRGNFIAEATLTQIFDQPTSPFPQDQTRFWLRAGVKF